MCRLLESIKYQNGKLHNIAYHEERMMRAVRSVFKKDISINLKHKIEIPNGLNNGLYKCRIIYDPNIIEVKFTVYRRKKITSFHLITDEKISYPHKFENRYCINRHTEKLRPGQEIIFVKKGMLRDASYSNIALYNGTEWHTPSYPLLKGTQRASLLEQGILHSKKIMIEDLKNYKRISFINALNNLDELSLDL